MKPYKDYLKTPDSYQGIYDTIEFVTRDSLTLSGWYIHSKIPDSRKPSIILVYGDAGNMSYFIDYADEFSKNGYSVSYMTIVDSATATPFRLTKIC